MTLIGMQSPSQPVAPQPVICRRQRQPAQGLAPSRVASRAGATCPTCTVEMLPVLLVLSRKNTYELRNKVASKNRRCSSRGNSHTRHPNSLRPCHLATAGRFCALASLLLLYWIFCKSCYSHGALPWLTFACSLLWWHSYMHST